MYATLFDHIRKFVPLNGDEEALLSLHLHHKTVTKKSHLLKGGQICTANYFVIKGCFRMYVISEDGNEQIIQFGIDNWWITDYLSFDKQTPSQFYIQAVEPSEIVVLDRQIQDELFRQIPQLERYFRMILQRAYSASLMRIQYMFNLSGEALYHQFSSSFPDFVQRVPQYMLASYLGFTPEFLSKIRAKKS